MIAGKLLIKFAALAPVLAVAGMGYVARRPHQPFHFVQYTERESKVLDAYIPVLKAFEEAVPSNGHVSKDKLRSFADSWIDQKRAGLLQPVRPSFYEESDEDGPRSEVISAWDDTLSELQILEHNEALKGDWSEAAQDMDRIIKFIQVVKYSDTIVMGSANSQERGLLTRLRVEASQFSQPCRLKIAADLEHSSDSEAFHQLMTLNKENLEAYVARLDAISAASDATEKAQEDVSDKVTEQTNRTNECGAREERVLYREAHQLAADLRRPVVSGLTAAEAISKVSLLAGSIRASLAHSVALDANQTVVSKVNTVVQPVEGFRRSTSSIRTFESPVNR